MCLTFLFEVMSELEKVPCHIMMKSFQTLWYVITPPIVYIFIMAGVETSVVHRNEPVAVEKIKKLIKEPLRTLMDQSQQVCDIIEVQFPWLSLSSAGGRPNIISNVVYFPDMPESLFREANMVKNLIESQDVLLIYPHSCQFHFCRYCKIYHVEQLRQMDGRGQIDQILLSSLTT
jgi:hypothetical protein